MIGFREESGFDGKGGSIFGGGSWFLEIAVIDFTSRLIFEYYLRVDRKILHHLSCYFSLMFLPYFHSLNVF